MSQINSECFIHPPTAVLQLTLATIWPTKVSSSEILNSCQLQKLFCSCPSAFDLPGIAQMEKTFLQRSVKFQFHCIVWLLILKLPKWLSNESITQKTEGNDYEKVFQKFPKNCLALLIMLFIVTKWHKRRFSIFRSFFHYMES